MSKYPYRTRRAWASGRTTVGAVYDTKREVARNVGHWNAKRVAVVDVSPDGVAALVERTLAAVIPYTHYEDDRCREHDGFDAEDAHLVLEALLGPLPKAPTHV